MSLLIKIGTNTSNTFLPMRNKCVYSCSIKKKKIHALGVNELLESIFSLLLVVEVFSLQNGIRMLEETVVGWQEVRWIWQMKQNSVAQFIQLLIHWLCINHVIMEENWALSVDQCQLKALQVLVNLIDLLRIRLRCNSFTRIQKVVVDRTISRPPNSDQDLSLM